MMDAPRPDPQHGKCRFLCKDGPMIGEWLFLHCDGRSITFRLGERIGRYLRSSDETVHWEEQK